MLPRGFRLPLPVWVIIGGLGLVSAGTYMVIPFYAIYLTKHLGLTAGQVGIALAVRTLTGSGLTFAGGILSDRFGAKRLMVMGLILRALAFAAFPMARTFWEVLLYSTFLGLASALYMPAGKAAVTYLTPRKHRMMVLSLRTTAANVGVAIGPLVGTWLAQSAPAIGFYAAAASGLLCLLATVWWIPATGKGVSGRRIKMAELSALLKSPGIWSLVAFNLAFWALYSQFELTMPLHVGRELPNIGPTLLFTVNALVVIFCQLPLTAWIEKKWAPKSALSVGMLATGLGFAGLVWAGEPVGLVTTMVVFTIGEIFVGPVLDFLTVELSPKLAGTALGFMALAVAVGGALGTTAGGPIYEWTLAVGRPALFWYGSGLAAALVGALVLLRRGAPRKKARRPAVLVAHWCAVAQPGKATALRRLLDEYRTVLAPACVGRTLPGRLYRGGAGMGAGVFRLELEVKSRGEAAALAAGRCTHRGLGGWYQRLLDAAEPDSLTWEIYSRSE